MKKPRKPAGAGWHGMDAYKPMRELSIDEAAAFDEFMSAWVGTNYGATAPRILVVGESAFRHGGPFMPASWELRDYSRWCVRLARDGKPHPFWTKLCYLLSGLGIPGQRREVLDHIVYFLALPGILESRVNRDAIFAQKDYTRAKDRLLEMVRQHRPDRVLVLGKDTARIVRVDDVSTDAGNGLRTMNDFGDVRLGVLTHPQSPHYRKAAALDLVRRLAS